MLLLLHLPLACSTHEPEPPIAAQLFALRPTSGPTAGGTVLTFSGAHLVPSSGQGPVCRFGYGDLTSNGRFRGRASHGIVTCVAPVANVGYEVAVELSVDNERFTSSGFRFTYYHEAVVSLASPSAGPAAGGTTVTVTGFNFAATAGLQCAFGWRRVPATYLNFQHVRCGAPMHAANGTVTFSFEESQLHMRIDQNDVDGLAALGGEALLAAGLLRLADERPRRSSRPLAPPVGASLHPQRGGGGQQPLPLPQDRRIATMLGSSARDARVSGGLVRNEGVQVGCGVLSFAVPRDTHVAPRGFSAEFELLMRGEAARGAVLSYGLLRPDDASVPAPPPPPDEDSGEPAEPTYVYDVSQTSGHGGVGGVHQGSNAASPALPPAAVCSLSDGPTHTTRFWQEGRLACGMSLVLHMA